MTESRNKLVIIGNGFDLAHGLKTSYNHFIKWYLNSILGTINFENVKHIYEDKLIRYVYRYQGNIYLPDLNKIDIIDWFFEEKRFGSSVKQERISPLLDKLIGNSKEYSWINIEMEFYKSLIEIYSEGQKPFYDLDYYTKEVEKLNSDFEFIKDKLEEYLNTIDCKNIKVNVDISCLFQSDFCVGYLAENTTKTVHYLNFNYTNTIENYIWPQSNYQLNYIHGKLNNKVNPLIFGYGDEIEEYYKKIENININEFLNNFKSFGYFKTENYSNLLRFIDSEPYDIEILGHSCGLSDRVLLNTIFEHDKCQSIKIHYHQKSETENDFITKTQEISRHFKDKAKMRARIVDFTKCKPLVKYKPNN